MIKISNKYSKYIEFSIISIKEQFAYPLNMLGRILIHMFRVTIFGLIYSYLYSKTGSNELNGFSLTEAIWSLALIQIVYQSARNVFRNMKEDIRTGLVEVNLNKPYKYIYQYYMSTLGEATIKAPLFFIATFVTLTPIWGFPSISIAQGIFMFLTIYIGILLMTTIQISIALCTFWIEDPDPIYWITSKMSWVIDGTFVPLAIMPQIFKTITLFLPVSLPCLVGRTFEFTSFLDLFKAISIQFILVLIIVKLNNLFYAKSVEKISINGG